MTDWPDLIKTACIATPCLAALALILVTLWIGRRVDDERRRVERDDARIAAEDAARDHYRRAYDAAINAVRTDP